MTTLPSLGTDFTFRAKLLDWTARNVERFRPPREVAAGDAPDEEPICLDRKGFAELGLSLQAAMRSPATAGLPQVASLAERWVDMVREQDVFFDLENKVGRTAYFASILASAQMLAPGKFEAVRPRLQQVLDRGFVDRVERSHWSHLDLIYLLDSCGVRHRLGNPAELVAASSLGRPPELPYVRDIDLYAITHLLFDITESGSRPPDPALGELEPVVTDYLHAALALVLAERNWDLVAELLLCRLSLGKAEPIDRHGWACLRNAQHPSGYVPASAAADLAGCDPPQLFAKVYHPTLVCLILAAVSGWA